MTTQCLLPVPFSLQFAESAELCSVLIFPLSLLILYFVVCKSIRTRQKFIYLVKSKPFHKQALVFTCLQYKSFENMVEKGENARNEQFLLFPLESACLLSVCPSVCPSVNKILPFVKALAVVSSHTQ